MAKLLSLAMLTAGWALAQSVEGSVFDASTGAGVPAVKVELLRGTTAFYETDTDGGGRFRFDGIREAEYGIRYRHPNYWLTAGSSDYKTFAVPAGGTVKVEARLMPWSKISGRVVDPDGQGVANALLELVGQGILINGRTYLRTSWGGGGGGALNEGSMRMTFSGKADAHGKFEVQVMPGNYSLSAMPGPALKAPGEGLGWKKTAYEGAITVLPGVDAPEIVVKLKAVPTHAVRGVVLGADGTPVGDAKLTLGLPFNRQMETTTEDGTFEFLDVTEGEWHLTVRLERLAADEWIEVTKHDVEGLRLRLAPAVTLRGKIVVDVPKDAPVPKEKPGPVILSIRNPRAESDADLAPGLGVLFDSDRDGNLLSENAYPGVYRLTPQLQPPPAPFYLDSVTVGGADVTNHEVEIGSDASVMMVYKMDGGTVRGTAEKCFSGGVLLVPQDVSLRGHGFSRSGACDDSGHYEIAAVRPGEYYALAFAGNGLVVPVDDGLLGQSSRVTVKAGETSSLDLKAVTRPVF